ncbi:hypothetical protein [Ectobacillus ponti]|uniref:Uncharacterized protein n=1 Tax=Ectobacillus ponti TaxID=2961894 RepID=A0AA42BQM4_9BACI|nr:hypothetical protein [Ectobacillus ponti]MCP8969551.1 hypothetical protein [Ectobacillus ponti]
MERINYHGEPGLFIMNEADAREAFRYYLGEHFPLEEYPDIYELMLSLLEERGPMPVLGMDFVHHFVTEDQMGDTQFMTFIDTEGKKVTVSSTYIDGQLMHVQVNAEEGPRTPLH